MQRRRWKAAQHRLLYHTTNKTDRRRNVALAASRDFRVVLGRINSERLTTTARSLCDDIQFFFAARSTAKSTTVKSHSW